LRRVIEVLRLVIGADHEPEARCDVAPRLRDECADTPRGERTVQGDRIDSRAW
jgi:hypothetical protein